MQEKPLLLPSAKSGVLVAPARSWYAEYLRWGAIAVGIGCVLVGAADVAARAARSVGSDSTFLAFGPAIAITNPGVRAATSTPGVITPARLKIPALGVDAAVEPVGVKDDGTMGTPQDFKNVSWYSLGAKPGEAGSAVFAGHVNNALARAGVFEHLSKIKKGDYLTVEAADGRSKVYQVSLVEEYAAGAPTEAIFAATGASQVVLITCDGAWVPAARTFDKRLVVVAKPAY